MFVTLIRTVILYVLAIVSIRVMGKRQIGELQPSDLVVTLLISQIISIPIQDTDIPLVNTLIPIFLLVGFEILTSVFNMKSIKFRTFMQGHPVVIINDGVLNQKLLKDLRFTIDDLLEALRQKDIFDIAQVQYAVVETNGQISVLLKPEYDTVTREDLENGDIKLVISMDKLKSPEYARLLQEEQRTLDARETRVHEEAARDQRAQDTVEVPTVEVDEGPEMD